MFDVEKIRGEFPILGREVYGKPLVYLDNGATAQKPLAVIETIDYLNRELNANIHRGVHYLSEEATTLYEASRERIRAFIGAAEKEEVIFTAGATASLNTVAYAWGEKFVRAGDNIVVSEMEHHSNIVPWQMLCERKGAEIRVLPFDDEGRLRTELLPSLLDGRTRAVAVTQASNTLGTRPELRGIIDAAHAVGAIAVVDGCQGVVHGQFFGRHRARRSGEIRPALRSRRGRAARAGAAAPRDRTSRGDRRPADLRHGAWQMRHRIVQRRGRASLRYGDDSRQARHRRPYRTALRRAGDGPLRDDGHVPRFVRALQHAGRSRRAGRRGRTGRADAALRRGNYHNYHKRK